MVVCALEAAWGADLRTCGGLKFLGNPIDSDDHALNTSSMMYWNKMNTDVCATIYSLMGSY